MKNNKGFTLIELGVSIGLVTIVAILLFQIINSVKKVYSASDSKTTLLTKQAMITKKIYDDLDQNNLISINSCDVLQNSCLAFNYDGKIKKLEVNPLDKTVAYDNYKIDFKKIDDTIFIDQLKFDYSNTDFFSISIPIFSKNLEMVLDINIVELYTDVIAFNYSPKSDVVNIPVGNNTYEIRFLNNEWWATVYRTGDSILNNYMKDKMSSFGKSECSSGDYGFYEFKSSTTTRWCQSNNFYTQKNTKDFKSISGNVKSGLTKDNYETEITGTGSVSDDILYLKVTDFMNIYTFKER